MNPLDTINLALRVWVLILEGMSIEQRQVLMQRFINDTGAAREKWDHLIAWFVGLLDKADKEAKAKQAHHGSNQTDPIRADESQMEPVRR